MLKKYLILIFTLLQFQVLIPMTRAAGRKLLPVQNIMSAQRFLSSYEQINKKTALIKTSRLMQTKVKEFEEIRKEENRIKIQGMLMSSATFGISGTLLLGGLAICTNGIPNSLVLGMPLAAAGIWGVGQTYYNIKDMITTNASLYDDEKYIKYINQVQKLVKELNLPANIAEKLLSQDHREILEGIAYLSQLQNEQEQQ